MLRMKSNLKSPEKKHENLFKGKLHNVHDDLMDRLQRLPDKHERMNEALRAINTQGKRVGPKLSQSIKTKLLALYDTALKQCESEHSTLRHILADIQKIRLASFEQKLKGPLPRGSLMMLLAQHANSLPLYAGVVDGHPPPLVGAIPSRANAVLERGDFVAAFVENVWILAYIEERMGDRKYSVRDVDDQNGEHVIVPAARIIPLPHYRADPRRDAHALFPRNAIVLALYPQTTCFYKGVVETPPALPSDDYQIAFEDDTFPSGYSPTLPVAQRYVVAHRDVEGGVPRRRIKEPPQE